MCYSGVPGIISYSDSSEDEDALNPDDLPPRLPDAVLADPSIPSTKNDFHRDPESAPPNPMDAKGPQC
ncbi:hypothetical protein AHF37_12004 [Paragonimus kellicotti]|nr:hypothetical protein AHF37_12004 [Paragonimus kellicotti]